MARSVTVPRGLTPVLHTHPTSPLPSVVDFMNVPEKVTQYIENPQGGVLFLRTSEFRGIFTAPGTGEVVGEWTAWGGYVFKK